MKWKKNLKLLIHTTHQNSSRASARATPLVILLKQLTINGGDLSPQK
jgi:hypothetical protein